MVGSSEISAGFAGSVLGGLASGNTTTTVQTSSSSSLPSLPTRDDNEVKEQSAIKRMLNFSSLATSIDRGFQSNNDILNKLHVSVNLRLDGIQKLLRKQTQILELAYKHQQSWADEERKLALNNKSLPAVVFNNIKKELDRFIKAFTETVKPEEFRKSMMRALSGTAFGKNMLNVGNYNKHLGDAPSTMTKKLKDILENIPNYFDKFSESVNKNLSTINARQREDNNRQLNCCLTSVSLLEKIVAQIETFRLAYAKVNGIHNRQGKSFDDRNFSRSLTRTKGEGVTLGASLEALNKTTKEFKHVQIQFNDNYLEKQESMNKALTNITLYILKPKYFVQYLLPLLFSVNMYRKYMAPMISTAMNSVTPFMQETFKQQNFARFVPIKDSLVNLIEKILPERAFKAFSATGTRIVTLVKTAFNAVFGTDLEKTNARQSIADAVGKTTSKLFMSYVLPAMSKMFAAYIVISRSWSSMKSFGNDMPGHYKKSMQDVGTANSFGKLMFGNNKAKKDYQKQMANKIKAMESADGFDPNDSSYLLALMQQKYTGKAMKSVSNRIVAPVKKGYRWAGKGLDNLIGKRFDKLIGNMIIKPLEKYEEIMESSRTKFNGGTTIDPAFYLQQYLQAGSRRSNAAKKVRGAMGTAIKAPLKLLGGGMNVVGKGLAMTRIPGVASVGGFLSGAGSSMMGRSMSSIGGAGMNIMGKLGTLGKLVEIATMIPVVYEGTKLFFNSFTKKYADKDKFAAFASGSKNSVELLEIFSNATVNFIKTAIPSAIKAIISGTKFLGSMTFGLVKGLWTVVADGVMTMVKALLNPKAWGSNFISASRWFTNAWNKTSGDIAPKEEMPPTVQETVEKTLTPMEERLSSAAEGFKSTMDNIREFFSKDFKPMMEKTFSSMGKSIKDLFAFGVEMFTKLKDGMSPLLGTIAGSMGAFMHGFFGADSANQILDRAIANSEKAGNTRVASFLKTSKSSVMDLMKAAAETQMTAANIQMDAAKLVGSSLEKAMAEQGLSTSEDSNYKFIGNSAKDTKNQAKLPKTMFGNHGDVEGYSRTKVWFNTSIYKLNNPRLALQSALVARKETGSMPSYFGNMDIDSQSAGSAGSRKDVGINTSDKSSLYRSIIPVGASFVDKDNYLEPRDNGKGGTRPHWGNDLSRLAEGTKLTVPLPGKVKYSGFDKGGYGNYIVVDHPNDYQTIYGHLSKSLVSAGDIVNIGDIIGLSGNTGRSTGPHLHFEVKQKGVRKNPTSFLAGVATALKGAAKPFEPSGGPKGSTVVNMSNGGSGGGGPLPNVGLSGKRTVINGQVREGTLAQRNFNPGNIRYYPSSSVNKFAIGHANKFLVFPDEMTGFKAMDYLITGSKTYNKGNMFLNNVIEKYAPRSENDTSGYIKSVLARTKLGNRRMVDYSEDERIMIYKAMAMQEGYYRGKAKSAPSFGIQMVNNGNAQTMSDINSKAKAMDYNNSAQIASTNWSGGGDMGAYKPETRPIIVDGKTIIYANQGGSTTVANSNSTNAGGGGGDFSSSWNSVVGI